MIAVVEQALLNGIGKIDTGYTPNRPLDGLDVEEIAFEHLGAESPQMFRALVDRVNKCARVPPDMPIPRDRQILARVLLNFGAQLLREVSDPTVISVLRLAIAEAERAPEIARVINSIGRETSRTALTGILAQALSFGLLEGNPAEMAAQFSGLLWGDLMLSLLLHVINPPKPNEIRRLARRAATAFLRLYPQPSDRRV